MSKSKRPWRGAGRSSQGWVIVSEAQQLEEKEILAFVAYQDDADLIV